MHAASFFFFNDTATTEIYTLSLHDALPISKDRQKFLAKRIELFPGAQGRTVVQRDSGPGLMALFAMVALLLLIARSEEHTSELQSQSNLVCRLLLDKQKRVCRRVGTTTLRR